LYKLGYFAIISNEDKDNSKRKGFSAGYQNASVILRYLGRGRKSIF